MDNNNLTFTETVPVLSQPVFINNNEIDDLFKKVDDQLQTHNQFNTIIKYIKKFAPIPIGILVLSLLIVLSFKYVNPIKISNITMDKLWEYKTLASIYSTPVIDDINNDHRNDVIINSTDGKMYVLDGITGKRIFFFETESPLIASPIILKRTGRNKLIILAGQDNKVYAIDGKEHCLWSTIKQDFDTSVISTPVLMKINNDNILDIVLAGMNGKVYALDGDRGWLIWSSKSTEGKFFSTPLITRINRDNKDDLIIGSPENRVYGIDGQSGLKIWEQTTAGPVNSSAIALDKNSFLIGDEMGNLYTMDTRTGAILQQINLNASIVSTPVIINRESTPLLIVPLNDGSIKTFSPKNLKPLWIYSTKYQDPFTASPAIYDINHDGSEDIVITSRNGYVYIINGVDGTNLSEPYFTGNSISSSPILADINRDKYLDIVFGSENGSVYALTIKTVPGKIVKANQIAYGSFLNRNNENF